MGPRRRRGQDWVRVRRERLEARLADGHARLEQARTRSAAVDAAVEVLRWERPVPPASWRRRRHAAGRRRRGGGAALWFALSWALPHPAVPWTALVPGSLLFAGGFLAYNLAVTLYFAPRAARASAVYGSLGVALVLLVSLFLFGRLAVAAAELNATMWERRAQRPRLNTPPP